MMYEEISRRRRTKYADTLDELLGIRPKQENTTTEVAQSKQGPVERPTTRHGRKLEAVPPIVTSDSFSPLLKPDIINKSGVIVERWQRESDEEEGDEGEDEDEDENEDNDEHKNDNDGNGHSDEQSDSESSSKNGTEIELPNQTQEIERADGKYRTNDTPGVQKLVQRATNDAVTKINNSQRSFVNLNKEQSPDQSIPTVRQLNKEFPSEISEPSTAKKTSIMERKPSVGNSSRSTFRNSEKPTPGNDASSEAMKSVRKHSATMTRLNNEGSSAGKAAYEAWLREKVRQEKKKRCEQKEKEEKEKRAKEARKKEAEKNFEIWKQQTDEMIRERRRKEKKKAEELIRKEKEEMKRKNEEATQTFQAWKNDRLQRLSSERKERLQNKEIEKMKKQRECVTKQNEAHEAFNAWCKEKKIRNEEEQRKLLQSKRTQETQSRNEKEYKQALAKEAYDVWLKIKENERRFNESLQGRIMKFDEISRQLHPVPWIPPSNVIPRQFVSKHTRRNHSVNRSAKSNQASYRKFPSATSRSRSALR